MARTLGDAWIRVRPDMSTFPAETSRGVDAAGRPVESRMSTIAKRAGLALGAAGAYGAVAFSKGAATLEAEYGKTMNQLKANLGVPQAEMRKLGDLAMKMGADTTYSAKDASEAMLELARGGMTAAAIKGGALESSLTLAAAGGVTMTRSAEVMGNALNTFGLRAGESTKVAAALAGAANASSASIDSIAQGLQQAGTVAADAGFSIQETTGSIAALANAGIAGSDAGTSLKTMFSRLLPTTKAASEAFEAYGLSSYQSSASLKELREKGINPVSSSMGDVSNAIREYLVRTGQAGEGTMALEDKTKELLYSTGMMQNAFVKNNGEFKSLTAIAGVLESKFSKLSGTERAAALNSIFGSDARRAATVLTNEGSAGLAKYVKATSDAGAADRQAAAATKGTAGAIERMKGSIETAQLAWGKAQKPIVTFGATVLTHIANGAVPHIERMGKTLREGLANVDTSSLKNMLKSLDFGEVATGASDLSASVRSIDWSSVKNGVGTGVTDALSVFGVVIKFAAENLDTLAKLMPVIAAGFVVYKVAQLAANVAMGLSVPLRVLEIVAIRHQTAAIRGLAGAQGTSNVATATSTTLTVRQRIAALASAAATKVVAVATKAWAIAQRVLNLALRANPIGIVITVLAALAAAVVLAYKKSDTFRAIVDNAWAKIKTAVSVAWNQVIKPALKALWGYITNTLIPVIRILWERVVKPVFSGIGRTIKGVWNGVIKPVFGALKTGIGAVRDAFGTAIDAIGRIWSKLKSVVMAPVRFVIDTVINKGLIGGFNFISEKVGGPQLPYVKFGGGGSPGEATGPSKYSGDDRGLAEGGVLPGYTPGRDVHHFVSPTAGKLHLSGGEAIMRPEFTRAVGGARGVAALNARARKGKLHGPLPERGFFLGGVMPLYAGALTNNHGAGYYGASFAGDLNGPYDTSSPPAAVKAWKAGTVASAQSISGSYGNHIRINHAGQSSLYAHLSSMIARAGQSVSAGQMIGRVGSTGNSTGPHLHFEVRGGNVSGSTGGGVAAAPAIPAWAQKILGSAVGWVEDRISGPLAALKSKFPNNAVAGLAAAMPEKLVSAMGDWVQGKVESEVGSMAGAAGVSTAGISGPVVSQVQQVAERYGWGSGAQWASLKALVQQESSWNPNADNPTSSAAGLFQKMTSIHGPVEGTAAGQAAWGLNYIKGRYGNPVAAWNFHRANNYYGEGGVLPTFDRGGVAGGKGYLPKATVRPERVLSPRQTDLHDRQTVALEQLAGQARGGRERFELTITNWDIGKGVMQRVAGREYDIREADHARLDAATRGA